MRAQRMAERQILYKLARPVIAGAEPTLRTFEFGPVSRGAIRAARTQWRTSRFDWAALAAKYDARYDRFEVAIWSGVGLSGLAFGRFSPARKILSVNFIEAQRDVHPLSGRVTFLVAKLAEIFALSYGSDRVRVTEPLDVVKAKLLPLGYRFVARGKGVTYDCMERGVP